MQVPTLCDVDRLLGPAELARLIGVSRQRVSQLAQKPTFPAPLAVLEMGSVWALGDLTTWAEATGRTLNLDAITPSVQDDDKGDPHGKRVS